MKFKAYTLVSIVIILSFLVTEGVFNPVDDHMQIVDSFDFTVRTSSFFVPQSDDTVKMDITIQNNWKDMFIGNITVFISGTAYYGNMCNPTFYVTNELSPDEFRALLPEECEKDQFDYTEIIPINSIVQKDADPTIIHHEIPKQSDNFFLAVFSMDVFYPLNRSAMGSFDANCYYDSNTYSIESEINERGLPMLYFITTRPCGEIGCPAGMVCGEMGVCIHGAGYVDILKYALLGVGVFLIVLEVWLWKRNEKPTGKSSKKNDQKTNLNKENKK